MKRVVTYAKLHADVFIPGLGGLGSTLPPGNKSVKMEMYWTETGLYIATPGHEIIVPHANVIVAKFGAEAPQEAKPAPEAKAPVKKA